MSEFIDIDGAPDWGVTAGGDLGVRQPGGQFRKVPTAAEGESFLKVSTSPLRCGLNFRALHSERTTPCHRINNEWLMSKTT